MERTKGASPNNRNTSTSNIDGKSAISGKQKSSLLFKTKLASRLRAKNQNGGDPEKRFPSPISFCEGPDIK